MKKFWVVVFLCWINPLFAEPSPGLPSEAEVQALFEAIRDPVDLSFNDAFNDLSALEPVIDQYPEDTQRMFQRNWCWYQYNEDLEDYITYADALLADPGIQQSNAAQADLLSCKGYFLYLQSETDDALATFDAAEELARSANDTQLIADIEAMRGEVYSYFGESAQALTRFRSAFELYNDAGNVYFTNLIRSDIARVLRRMGAFDDAQVYLDQQLAYYQQVDDVLSEADVQIDYGLLFLDQQEYDNAVDRFNQAIDLFNDYAERNEVHELERLDASALLYKAEALARMRRTQEAKAALEAALAIMPDSDEIPSSAPINLVKASIANGEERHLEAISLAQDAMDTYDAEGNQRMMVYALQEQVMAYEQLQDFEMAYRTLQTITETQETLRRRSDNQLSQRMKVEYDLAQKEIENQALMFENQRQELKLTNQQRVRRWQTFGLLLGSLLVLIMGQRVMAQIKRASHLKALAMTDPLTELANRRAIESLTEETFSLASIQNQPVSLLTFDIDHFKVINDTHGHDIGDLTIQHVAQVAKAALRTHDTLARYGGEEFLALLPGADLQQAQQVAERICRSIAEAILTTDAGPISVTVSIGVAQRTRGEQSPGQTIRRADQAMYSAKKNGRNQVVIQESAGIDARD